MSQGLETEKVSSGMTEETPQSPAFPKTQFVIGHSEGCVFWKKLSHVRSIVGLVDTSAPPALNSFTKSDGVLGTNRLFEQSRF